MSARGELKRHNAYKAGAAYAIAAWLKIRASATIFLNLKPPPWTLPFVIVILIIDFSRMLRPGYGLAALTSA
jgi:hypothetical protein